MDLQQKNAVGVREDISDIVIELDAEETPAFSIIPKGEKPTAPVLQQPVDAPGFVSRHGVRNKTPAGGATDQSKDYALLESENHWVRATIGVGKKDIVTANRAGVGLGKLYAREVVKGIKAMKTAVDCITLDDSDQKSEGSEGSETRGLFSWASPTAQKCRPVPEKYRPNAGQLVTTNLDDITPDTIASAMSERWLKTKSAGRLVAFCGDKFKRHVSNWSMYVPNATGKAVVRQFSQTASKKERVLAAIIDLLEFDTGTMEFHLEPNLLCDRNADENSTIPDIARRSCIAFSENAVSYHFAEDIEHEELPYDGGSKTGQISAIFHTMARPFDLVAIKPAA